MGRLDGSLSLEREEQRVTYRPSEEIVYQIWKWLILARINIKFIRRTVVKSGKRNTDYKQALFTVLAWLQISGVFDRYISSAPPHRTTDAWRGPRGGTKDTPRTSRWASTTTTIISKQGKLLVRRQYKSETSKPPSLPRTLASLLVARGQQVWN